MAVRGQSGVICNTIIRKHIFPERKSIELCTFPCNISSLCHQPSFAHSYTTINSLRVNGFLQKWMDLQQCNRANARAIHGTKSSFIGHRWPSKCQDLASKKQTYLVPGRLLFWQNSQGKYSVQSWCRRCKWQEGKTPPKGRRASQQLHAVMENARDCLNMSFFISCIKILEPRLTQN